MALTKSVKVSGSSSGSYTYKCEVTENSTNVNNNTSNVTIAFYIKGPWSQTAFTQWTTYYGIYVDGVLKQSSSSSPTVAGSYVHLITWTGDIAHDNDGSKTINVGIHLYFNGSAWYLPVQYTSSSPFNMGSITLTTIPRASSLSLSATSVDVGSSITANITRASTSFTHTVEFYINSSYHQEYTSIATSRSFTIPTSWYAAMPTSTSCTAYCRITTYNGSTQIGSQVTKTFTVNVPSSIKPTVGTITLTPQTYSDLIQNKNKVTVSVSGCSAGTGSSIKSYTFSGPNLATTVTTNTSATSGIITSSGSKTYTVVVTDNRGRTAVDTATITCYAYETPYFSRFEAYRANSDGSKNDSGSYIQCTYTLVYYYVDNSNARKSFGISGGTSLITYGTWTETQSNGVVTAQGSALINLDGNTTSTYKIKAAMEDTYGGKASSVMITVFGASRIMNITKDGTGVAFGKMAEASKLLESKYKIKAPGLQSTRNGRDNLNLNIASDEDHANSLEYYIVKADLTNNAPPWDGHIIHCHWDAISGYDTQLYLRNDTGTMMTRGCSGGTWGDWQTVAWAPVELTSFTVPSYYTGSAGTITLSQSAADFTYLEIFYCDNNSKGFKSTKVYLPNNRVVELSLVEASETSQRVYIRASKWLISETSMVFQDGKHVLLANGNIVTVDDLSDNTGQIKIAKVIGYK